MGKSELPSPVCQIEPRPVARIDFSTMLRDADALLGMMGREPLDVVANLASSVSNSATDAGDLEIAEAASAIQRIASSHRPAALTGSMRDLTAAIARARHARHFES